MIPEDATSVAKYMYRIKSIVGGDYYFVKKKDRSITYIKMNEKAKTLGQHFHHKIIITTND